MKPCQASRRTSLRIPCSTAVVCLALTGGLRSVQAVELPLDPDWVVNWDNTVTYNLGMRAQGINPGIGNNPVFAESDYKFAHAGDIVTNRISNLSEFDAVYEDKYGFRVSASIFKDFAYDSNVNTNPGNFAPGVPYSSLFSYANNRFTSYTTRYYEQGIQLLDAFTFGRFDIGGHSTTVKVGQLTEFWGNALFFGALGISYSQNAADNIKGSSQPGSLAKELALPRPQVLVSTQVTPTFTLEGQYLFEQVHNLNPEGGTYLGTAGFLFNGPQFVGGSIPRGPDFAPSNTNPNYGFKASWSPDWLRGTIDAYYRRFDEVQPWAPLFGESPATGSTNYHLAYAPDVHLYGLSLEKQIGNYSTGFEVSYRQHTALNSASGPLPGDLAGSAGARGDTINVIANVIAGLTRTPLWQTGSVTAEIAATHLTSITSNGALYNGTGNPLGCPTGNKWDGCSTRNSVSVAALFDPTWLQVFPNVDIDMPLFVEYGVYGNTASLGNSVNQGAIIYTAGVHALIKNKYNVTLQYNGYHAHTNGGTTPVNGGAASYYTSGNGTFFYNDRGWVSLTFQAAF
jgi:Protein of unknown function (DUF1302)